MNYNFDEIIDRRHTNALNTDGFRGYIFHAGPEKVFAFKDEEFVRMWVADMEFATPPEICEAMKKRIKYIYEAGNSTFIKHIKIQKSFNLMLIKQKINKM